MEPLSAGSGVLAVIGLAIQLVESVQKISKFLHSVQDAPDEVQHLARYLDLLYQHLDQARLLLEQQRASPGHPGSIDPLASALANCKTRVERLAAIVDKLQGSLTSSSRLHRRWGSLRVVYKKDEIENHQIHIRDTNAMLQSAILINVALTTNVYDLSILYKSFPLNHLQGIQTFTLFEWHC